MYHKYNEVDVLWVMNVFSMIWKEDGLEAKI